MVDIRIPEAERRAIAEQYYNRLVKWIDDNGKWSIKDPKADEMMRFIQNGQNNGRDFFLASPDSLENKSKEFSDEFAAEKKKYDASKNNGMWKTTSYGIFVLRMREIYNRFMQKENDNEENDNKEKDNKKKDNKDKNGYWLMKRLGVRVCPYCNINYTTTINKRTKNRTIQIRPEFDHFFPEAEHPSLILSFYNLVPSCPQCNHLKKVQKLEVNPWIKLARGIEPIFKVDTSTGDFPKKPVIIIENENENIKKLGIIELYNEHTDYVKDILDKIQAYNPATYLAILKDFQGIVHTAADLDRMIWGNYTELSDSDKRPFAKLTADILRQYEKYL